MDTKYEFDLKCDDLEYRFLCKNLDNYLNGLPYEGTEEDLHIVPTMTTPNEYLIIDLSNALLNAGFDDVGKYYFEHTWHQYPYFKLKLENGKDNIFIDVYNYEYTVIFQSSFAHFKTADEVIEFVKKLLNKEICSCKLVYNERVVTSFYDTSVNYMEKFSNLAKRIKGLNEKLTNNLVKLELIEDEESIGKNYLFESIFDVKSNIEISHKYYKIIEQQ